jgi:hypothetical protein
VVSGEEGLNLGPLTIHHSPLANKVIAKCSGTAQDVSLHGGVHLVVWQG